MQKFKGWIMVAVFLFIMSMMTACGNKEVVKPIQEAANGSGEMLYSKISTEEFVERLGQKETIIVDTRSQAEYIGWEMNRASRGGHIPGSILFPVSWLGEAENLEELLLQKGIVKEKEIIVYDAFGTENALLDALQSLGYENLYYYSDGIVAWSADENLPLEYLANYEKLVHPAWLNKLIQGEKPDTYAGNQYKIIEVDWGEPKAYSEGHIPGAIYLDTNELEEEPLWNRKSDKDLEKMLVEHGITYDTTVILYGKDNMAATRAASIMLYAGVEDVRLLDGGYSAWVDAGFEVETKVNEPKPLASFGIEVPARPEFIIDTEEARDLLASENGKLVAIRSWEEHIGKTSGYSYIKPKGRISGSIWGYAGSDAYSLEDYRNVDQTMRSYNEIAENWQELGVSADHEVAFYCGTGWRASEAFLAAYLMGWENIAVYDGGWYEWSLDEANPVETGEPMNEKSKK